ncbi:TerD family protein [Streptomyces monticola]|uniref:non-specific serine/threonine protein kinase n=1 Tax=Streptomyces monticola TaxID=2666263 RepID=A0ABW2JFR6_9ACTN
MVDGVGPGTVIGGRYALSRPLGAGGFGQVWKAYDRLLGVDVAVKRVLLNSQVPQGERAMLLARAAREARHAARLRDHPHIVTVYDVIEVEEVPWIVMQLVDGRSLADELREQGPLTVERAGRVAEALLRALDAAHRAGVTHRDVKPANVLGTLEGEVLLADFGIAVGHTDTRLTADAMVVGSPAYMAPERLQGAGADGRADLFSLGVTLYEAVEGVLPFPRGNPTAALTEPPRPPCRAGRLTPLITGLLERDPGQRPTAAKALAMLTPAPGPGAEDATTLIAPAGTRTPSPGASALLHRGGEVPLTHGAPPLTVAMVELNWGLRDPDGPGLDVDTSALLVGADGRVLSDGHFVFFNNPRSTDGSVEHLTVGDVLGVERIKINLSALPAQTMRVVFAASIYDAESRQLTFAGLTHLCARLIDPWGNRETARYEFLQEASTEHAVLFSEIYRHDDAWSFRAIGQGFTTGLRGIAWDHGVNV